MSEIVDGVCRRLSADKWLDVLACKFIDADMGCYLYVNPQGERRRTLHCNPVVCQPWRALDLETGAQVELYIARS